MERFVQSIVAGGLALVAGLWLLTGFERLEPGWIGALAVAIAGLVGLAVGIHREIEY